MTYILIPADAFKDPDGDALAYTASLATGDPLPPGMVFDQVHGIMVNDINFAVGEFYRIRITATDPAGLSVASDFTVSFIKAASWWQRVVAWLRKCIVRLLTKISAIV